MTQLSCLIQGLSRCHVSQLTICLTGLNLIERKENMKKVVKLVALDLLCNATLGEIVGLIISFGIGAPGSSTS